jgi:hypothetical protein
LTISAIMFLKTPVVNGLMSRRGTELKWTGAEPSWAKLSWAELGWTTSLQCYRGKYTGFCNPPPPRQIINSMLGVRFISNVSLPSAVFFASLTSTHPARAAPSADNEDVCRQTGRGGGDAVSAVRPCSRVFANSQNAPLTFGMPGWLSHPTDGLSWNLTFGHFTWRQA